MTLEEKPSSVHAGHRARIRERFRREGLSGFSEHEALELLLTFAIPQRDVNPLAHTLIHRFGSLSGVLETQESELMRVPGVGPNAAALLTLMPQLFGYYQRNAMGERPVITNLENAKTYCEALFFGAHEELVYMICLDSGGRVVHPALLHKGTVDEVMIYPREAVEIALRYHASAVLLAHNHPGGTHEPSQADYDTTAQVIRALSVVSVSVVDHLIFSGDSVYSMTKNSEFSVDYAPGFSYTLRSSVVPGRRGQLKEEGQEDVHMLLLENLYSGGRGR